MTIDERVSGEAIVLDLRGRMTIEALKEPFVVDKVRQLVQDGHKQVILNLAEVPYMDTSGLCTLVQAHLAATRRGGTLKLLHLTSHIRKILVVTRLSTVFDAYDTEAEAIASVRSGASL